MGLLPRESIVQAIGWLSVPAGARWRRRVVLSIAAQAQAGTHPWFAGRSAIATTVRLAWLQIGCRAQDSNGRCSWSGNASGCVDRPRQTGSGNRLHIRALLHATMKSAPINGMRRVLVMVPVALEEHTPDPPIQQPWLVADVLHPARCAAWVAAAQAKPWRDSAAQSETTATRRVTNAAADIDSALLYGALRLHLPDVVCGWRLLALDGERCVFLRYGPGDFFAVHTDSIYASEEGTHSLFAVLLYLNDDFKGGSTFFPDLGLTFEPELGAALIIPHGLRHEARPVTHGVKYGLHAYAMYRRVDPHPTNPRR